MPNFKKIGAISLLVGGLIFVAGCGSANSNNEQTETQTKQRGVQQGENASSTAGFLSMGTKASVADLVVGKKIVAMGSSNSDGSLNASSILIGEPENMMMGGGPVGATSTNGNISAPPQQPNQVSGESGGQPPSNIPSGERPTNVGDSQQGKMSGGGMRNKSISRVSGEIISKDEKSMVIKIKDGGSKIVFFSDKTEVFIYQPPTSSTTTTLPVAPLPTESTTTQK